MKVLSILFTGLVLVFFLDDRHKIILNVHTTVALVRNGIEHSIKLSLFYNFHSFVIHCRNIRLSEIACSPAVVPLNLKSFNLQN